MLRLHKASKYKSLFFRFLKKTPNPNVNLMLCNGIFNVIFIYLCVSTKLITKNQIL